jgi:hypothetical protein
MALAAEKPDFVSEKLARPVSVTTPPSSVNPQLVDPPTPIVEVVHGLEVTINRDLPAPGPELLDFDEEQSIAARAGLKIQALYRDTSNSVTNAYREFSYASGNVMRSVKRGAEHLKEEHPLKALAVIGTAAMALGIAARYWRSRNA